MSVWIALLFLCFFVSLSFAAKPGTSIVYVYAIPPIKCHDEKRFPHYLRVVLQQAVLTQGLSSKVYFLTNLKTCPSVQHNLIDKLVPKGAVHTVDIDTIASNHTLEVQKRVDALLSSGEEGLWTTATMRLLYLYDFMALYNVSHMLHVEGDNLLYRDIADILPALQTKFPSLAVTPLKRQNSFLTASVLWVGSQAALKHLSTFLSELFTVNTEWDAYKSWLTTKFP